MAIAPIYSAKAQPNGGFENWSTTFGVLNPDSWQTLNFLSFYSPNPISAFKVSGVDKHSGNYALKLQTIFISNNPAPNMLPDTVGGIFFGKVIPSPLSIKLGIPYTGRPQSLEFWAKYNPVGNDFAGAFVTLQKWNGTGHDTIAYGEIQIHTTLSYTLFQFNLDYQSTESPDTVIIGISSSYKASAARVGSTLYIDDVALTGWVGIDEHNNYADKVKVFPNPAKEYITINAQIDEADNMQVIDVSGKSTGVYKIQNYSANIDTGVFAEGIYFYQIRDKKNKVLTNGKFNVTK